MKQVRRAQWVGRGLAAGLAALGATGCAEAPGELVLVVQTDMSLPEDINMVQIEISENGITKYKQDFDKIGPGQFTLPATLGLVDSEDEPGASVTIRASGWKVSADGGEVLVMREVVTQVPEERVATLHLPLHYLCRGSANTTNKLLKEAESRCGDGNTCVGGSCVPSALDEVGLAALPEYLASDVFGGGTGKGDGACFDVARCFAAPSEALVDRDTCTFEAPPGDLAFNVALVTETEGMCNEVGCFVALDADSAGGWTRLPDGRIQLPAGACTPSAELLGAEPIAGVVTAPVDSACPQKVTAIPTCGPWSAIRDAVGAAEKTPVAVVSGQARPAALQRAEVLDVEAEVTYPAMVWASGGVLVEQDPPDPATPPAFERGSVSMALLEGGPAIELVGRGETSPRNVVVSGGYAYWTAAGTTEDGGTITRRQLALPLGDPEELLAIEVMNKPEGLAIGGGWLFWTDFEAGEVRRVMLGGSGSAAGPSELIAPGQNRPFRIATNDAFTCWTNEGTLMQQQGSVWCWIAATGSLLEVGPDQSTPREIAVTADAVYWADFGSGKILRARWDGAAFAAAEVLAEDQAYPNGIFVDGGDVYWTNRGDGAVRVLREGASAPEDVATGQDNPGTILVTGDEIFWINEGGLDGTGGVILRRVK